MGNIAGLEVGLPTSIDDITAAWMTKVLRTSGAIAGGDEVTSVANEPFADGAGLLSELYRSTLSYSDGSPAESVRPETVIVKFPTCVAHQRGIADAFNVYGREVKAYRAVVPRSPLRAPIVHAAMVADDRSNCCIVMEDLSHLRQADPLDGATWQQATTAVDALAAFHARWFGSEELDELSETFITFQNPLHLAAMPGIHAACWPATKRHAGDLLTPDVVAFGDRWGDLLPKMLDSVSTSVSLTHGDWRTDNMFFDADGEMVIFDFQIMGVGNGSYDLAYFISQSLERSVRAGRERELVERYVDQLAAHGVERDVEQMMFDTRVATALCLMYGFASFPEFEQLPGEGKNVARTILRRSVEAIVDLAAAAAATEL